jgi:hypothetical protein
MMTYESLADKREHPRILEEHGIAVKIIVDQGAPRRQSTIFRLTKDISHGGLCFLSTVGFDMKTPVKIHVALREPLKTVVHVGEVVWVSELQSDKYLIGVRFTKTPEMDMKVWVNYLETQLNATS